MKDKEEKKVCPRCGNRAEDGEILNNKEMDHAKLYSAEIEHDKTFMPLAWDALLPFIKFPTNWEIKIRPSFCGAIIRFSVKPPELEEDEAISVYLDGYQLLGYYGGETYWEAYPIQNDTERFGLDDIKGLIQAIKDEFKRIKNG